MTKVWNDLWIRENYHDDPIICNYIKLLMKDCCYRTGNDLLELQSLVKNVKFFDDLEIQGRDLLDVCELLYYERKGKGSTIVSFDEI